MEFLYAGAFLSLWALYFRADGLHAAVNTGQVFRLQFQHGRQMEQVRVRHVLGFDAARVFAPMLLTDARKRGHLFAGVTKLVLEDLQVGRGRGDVVQIKDSSLVYLRACDD